MDVTEILRDALQATVDAEVPDDLRTVAFAKAIELLGAATIAKHSMEHPNTNQSYSNSLPIAGAQQENPQGAGDSILDRIAQELKVGRDLVDEVYEERDGDLELVVSRSKIDSSKSAGTKELARLVVTGRVLAGLENPVPASRIRKVAEDFTKLDSANFSKTISELDDEFRVTGQKGKEKMLSPKRLGRETTAELIRRLGGGDV